MIEKLILLGSPISSDILSPLAAMRYSWELRFNCVKAIVRINDNKSLDTLKTFKTTTYWVSRMKASEYIAKRFEDGNLNKSDQEIALEILDYYLTDGKTNPKTKTMRITQDIYDRLTE